MKKINLNNKKILAIIIALIILAILLYAYIKIINKYRNNRLFALQAEKYGEEVNNPVFRIDRIMVYSGVDVKDFSEKQNLSRINVSQFTDFVVYINNLAKDDELTEENTINRIYVNNIGITAQDEMGTRKFSTKNIDNIGKYISIDETSKDLNYEVAHKNSDKDKINKSKSFYTDCSDPLIISYVNENILQSVDASASNEKLSLDGSILKHLNIDLNQLNYKINFTVNIENNLGENFACNCSLNVDLGAGSGEGIYDGNIMQIFDLSSRDYRFKKV